jgi:hypothetical protein
MHRTEVRRLLPVADGILPRMQRQAIIILIHIIFPITDRLPRALIAQ